MHVALVPFIVGAAIGAAVGWIMRDRQDKSRLEEGADAIAETASDAADEVRDAAEKGKDAVGDVAEKAGP